MLGRYSAWAVYCVESCISVAHCHTRSHSSSDDCCEEAPGHAALIVRIKKPHIPHIWVPWTLRVRCPDSSRQCSLSRRLITGHPSSSIPQAACMLASRMSHSFLLVYIYIYADTFVHACMYDACMPACTYACMHISVSVYVCR